jgi:hypothetical protein
MHAFCALVTTPKLPFCQNVKDASKSSHHEDLEAALTFGWFGDAFFVMNAQKSAILANSISTFYKVGIVGLDKKVARNHNTQHTKHNNQPK